MDLKGLKLFSSLHRKMSWLTDRQKILAENLANANTPGYRARDLKELRFSETLVRQSGVDARMVRTHPNHMKPPSTTAGGEIYEVRSSETKRNGNAVELERELAKVAEVQMDYAAATNLYRKHVSMLRTALGRGGG